ncbi:hypothetical protein CL622_04845 [archaeon]|nr:hypothetical protein [archaeon]|tara:strand:+ start:260 stop:1471 length:1212 start_codon:yes stop_codon:yes gene_type:complete
MAENYGQQIIAPGNQISLLCGEINKNSYRNSKAVEIFDDTPGFRGVVGYRWSEPVLQAMMRRKMMITQQNDGAGHKPAFCTLLGMNGNPDFFRTLSHEFFAMTADDAVAGGGFPVLFTNQIDLSGVNKNNLHQVKLAVGGMADVLTRNSWVGFTGETAIMPYAITAFCLDGSPNEVALTWTGNCTALMHVDTALAGREITAGMPIVVFPQDGFRCNGATLFLRILLKVFGKEGLNESDVLKLVEQLAVPSTIFAPIITKVLGWQPDGTVADPLADMRAVANVTGGGPFDRVSEMLPPRIGAVLDNMPDPSAVMKEFQTLSQGHDGLSISDHDGYSYLTGGAGMVAVCATASDADRLIQEAALHGVQDARIAGETVNSEDGEIKIKSRFGLQTDQWLSSLDEAA